MYIVYMHIAPNGKRYVGITSQSAESRWQKGNGYSSQKLFYRAICKYGWDNISHEIVATNLSKENAILLEKQLIKRYNTTDSNFGYNITHGGEGHSGTPITESAKRKLRESAMKQWSNPEIREKMISKRCKPVVQYTLDGVFVAQFPSVEAAKCALNVGDGIYYCANGKQLTAYGYVWKWVGQPFVPPREKPPVSEQTRRKLSIASKQSWKKRRRL